MGWWFMLVWWLSDQIDLNYHVEFLFRWYELLLTFFDLITSRLFIVHAMFLDLILLQADDSLFLSHVFCNLYYIWSMVYVCHCRWFTCDIVSINDPFFSSGSLPQRTYIPGLGFVVSFQWFRNAVAVTCYVYCKVNKTKAMKFCYFLSFCSNNLLFQSDPKGTSKWISYTANASLSMHIL